MRMTWLEILIVIVCISILGSGVYVGMSRPRDSTDPAEGPRSDLKLFTDHGTGCQYVAYGRNGISPRIGPDGKPICNKPN